MTCPRLGLTFLPTMAPESLPELAALAEDAGLDELWVWEDCFKHSAIASAAVALASTRRLRVGIGLMPAPLRNVALTAMEIATLSRIYPDRLTAGIGHGVQTWMGQVGSRVTSPLTLLREYAVALRALLAGEQVSVQGRYVQLDQVALDWVPSPAPSLMLGGAGDKSLALAGELGDGVMLSAALSVAEVAHAAEVSAVSTTGKPLVVSEIVAVGNDATERIRREVAIWRGRAQPDVGSAGGPADLADSLGRLVNAGASTVVIQPTEDEPDLAQLVRTITGDVRPLLT